MTVTYTAEVATCRGFGCFLKLLYRWRGSIYKLVWLDLACFLSIYYILNITYRVILSDEQKRVFESVVKYCEKYSNLIPLSFVLGFYVSVVMTRWWNQYISIPWPDSIAVFVSTVIHGQDERGRVMRRTIMRYVCLCLTMVLRNIAPRVKKRFPTLQHFVDAGLLLENEKKIMDKLDEQFPPYSKHWLPIVWASSIVTRARKEGRIRDDFAVKTVIDELNKFRGQCGVLISYDTISIPLVYTQVVTLAVYSYFVTSVMAQQWVENKTVDEGYLNLIDLYFPVFTTLQFFFYMGWLKVAESLINPFGEDDDDFEVNWMIDRNLQVSYIIVDEMHHDHPELIKDQYWDEVFPPELPYTIEAEKIREEIPQPSTNKVEVSKANAEVIHSTPSVMRMNDMVGKSNQSVNYKFPDTDSEHPEEDYGLQFTARPSTGMRNRPSTAGSTASMQSLAGTITRVTTVASALKKFFNREDSRTSDVALPTRGISGSASAASLQRVSVNVGPQGSVRIPDQIEEVDEQLTITSIRPDVRPSVKNIFNNNENISQFTMPQSEPIDIPMRDDNNAPYMRTQSVMSHVGEPLNLFPPGGVDALLSTSIPAGTSPIANERPSSVEIITAVSKKSGDDSIKSKKEIEIPVDPAAIETSAGQNQEDEFEKLRLVRENEKLERQKQKLTRTVSIHQSQIPSTLPMDEDSLIEELIEATSEHARKETEEN